MSIISCAKRMHDSIAANVNAIELTTKVLAYLIIIELPVFLH